MITVTIEGETWKVSFQDPDDSRALGNALDMARDLLTSTDELLARALFRSCDTEWDDPDVDEAQLVFLSSARAFIVALDESRSEARRIMEAARLESDEP